MNPTTPDRLLRRPEVSQLTGLSRATLYRYMRAGIFPTPVRIGPRAVGWPLSDIHTWIEDRKAESRCSHQNPV